MTLTEQEEHCGVDAFRYLIFLLGERDEEACRVLDTHVLVSKEPSHMFLGSLSGLAASVVASALDVLDIDPYTASNDEIDTAANLISRTWTASNKALQVLREELDR